MHCLTGPFPLGMFCPLGLEDVSLVVTAIVWLSEGCTMSPIARSYNPMKYVETSLASLPLSSSSSRNLRCCGVLGLNLDLVSTPTEKMPSVAVWEPSGGMNPSPGYGSFHSVFLVLTSPSLGRLLYRTLRPMMSRISSTPSLLNPPPNKHTES